MIGPGWSIYRSGRLCFHKRGARGSESESDRSLLLVVLSLCSSRQYINDLGRWQEKTKGLSAERLRFDRLALPKCVALFHFACPLRRLAVRAQGLDASDPAA